VRLGFTVRVVIWVEVKEDVLVGAEVRLRKGMELNGDLG